MRRTAEDWRRRWIWGAGGGPCCEERCAARRRVARERGAAAGVAGARGAEAQCDALKDEIDKRADAVRAQSDDYVYDDEIFTRVPLVVREGDNAEVLASLFAARYRLDDATRDELALAIVEHSKALGFVRPLFVLQVSGDHSRPARRPFASA